MVRIHVLISGFVQGVGLRFFIKRQAREFGLTGWARNRSDGKVEAIFEGSKEDVEKIIIACREGPFLANVSDVEVSMAQATGEFADFTIRF